MDVLDAFIRRHAEKAIGAPSVIKRNELIELLAQRKLLVAPQLNVAEITRGFERVSAIGREWPCTVRGTAIPRDETVELLDAIEADRRSILVKGKPGTGKTCVLLGLADEIESAIRDQRQAWSLLFIKGDQFTHASSNTDLASMGFPGDIAIACAQLARSRKVIVILDSLDVLSLHKDQGALALFLGLIRRLESIDNVIVVAACREFDLRYDPELKSKKWGQTIEINALAWQEVVAPLLTKLGIDPRGLSETTRTLLCVPQNLRLFADIGDTHDNHSLTSESELIDAYLREVVEKNPRLGEPALSAMYELAARLLADRELRIARSRSGIPEALLRDLFSSGVLTEGRSGTLEFPHQTLLDALVVRRALSSGMSLKDFILDQPPFLFIRPAVRTFLLHLRLDSSRAFGRGLRGALAEPRIARHIKRLLIETYAEMVPVDDDGTLIRAISRDNPGLFLHFLRLTKPKQWFPLLKSKWFTKPPIAATSTEEHGAFISSLSAWINDYPDEVIALWTDAVKHATEETRASLLWLGYELRKLRHWETPGVRALLDALMILINEDNEHGFFGKAISLYVSATDRGDDLLWAWVTLGLKDKSHSDFDLDDKLRCGNHEFHKKTFFRNRMKDSTALLELALSKLNRWTRSELGDFPGGSLASGMLHHTSWGKRHEPSHWRDRQPLGVLFDALENALIHHARSESPWWQQRESDFRNTADVSLRYLLIQAYKSNVRANLAGIEAQLIDVELFRYSSLDWELGDLMRTVYPDLPPTIAERNQEMILNLYDSEDFDNGIPVWATENIHEYLRWIPPMFRTPVTQELLDLHAGRFGTAIPQVEVRQSFDLFRPPLTRAEMLSLSDSALLRYLQQADRNESIWRSRTGERIRDDLDGIASIFTEAAAYNPTRFLKFFWSIPEQPYKREYQISIVSGLSDHVRYRIGDRSPPDDWQLPEDAPSIDHLIKQILTLLERLWRWGEEHHGMTRALEVCCSRAPNSEDPMRAVFLLFKLRRSHDPIEERVRINAHRQKEIEPDDLAFDAMNTQRGIGAQSAMRLALKLYNEGLRPPELLVGLLRLYARDDVASVRVSILRLLPYLTRRNHNLGWRLFDDSIRDASPVLWSFAEEQLYHQYHRHYENVAPYLDMMSEVDDVRVHAARGRLTCLATLSGHIEQRALLTLASTSKNEGVARGITQVLAANIEKPEHTSFCDEGLRVVLGRPQLSVKCWQEVEQAFSESSANSASVELALSLLRHPILSQEGHELRGVLDWLEQVSIIDVRAALDVSEAVVDALDRMPGRHQLWGTEALFTTLGRILREAEENPDANFTNRAVTLQDRLLSLDIHQAEEFINILGR
ncbi:MAG: AAA family ATPase [Gammaproteobacteria bacterium]